jgi:hypothetical protein
LSITSLIQVTIIGIIVILFQLLFLLPPLPPKAFSTHHQRDSFKYIHSHHSAGVTEAMLLWSYPLCIQLYKPESSATLTVQIEMSSKGSSVKGWLA